MAFVIPAFLAPAVPVLAELVPAAGLGLGVGFLINRMTRKSKWEKARDNIAEYSDAATKGFGAVNGAFAVMKNMVEISTAYTVAANKRHEQQQTRKSPEVLEAEKQTAILAEKLKAKRMQDELDGDSAAQPDNEEVNARIDQLTEELHALVAALASKETRRPASEPSVVVDQSLQGAPAPMKKHRTRTAPAPAKAPAAQP